MIMIALQQAPVTVGELGGNRWFSVKDGDPAAYALMRRHYSFQPYQDGRRQNLFNRNRYLFVGPGEKMVLMTNDYKALFVWRKFIDKSGQEGVNCAVFRNEGPHLSSELILEAEQLAWHRWPGERLYTYVDASQVKSANPGYCFKKACWRSCGKSQKRGLHILEKLPLTAHERDIIAALKDGCYLAELTGRVYLCDNRMPAYKRLVPVAILTNLLAAGLVVEAQAGVWQAKL